MPAPIRVAIFDLDDTLYDCFGQRVLAAHRCASEAMVKAGVAATAEKIFQVRMLASKNDPRLECIDAAVCRHFGVRDMEPVVRAARAAFFSMPVGRLSLFPGALPTLRLLRERGIRIFLVTFGDPEIQRAKVAALGLDRESSLERIYYADTLDIVTKQETFAAIRQETAVEPSQVLVVGDRPDSEIRAGKRLGMRTVRMRGGEFASLETQGAGEQADYEITSIDGILSLPLEFGQGAG